MEIDVPLILARSLHFVRVMIVFGASLFCRKQSLAADAAARKRRPRGDRRNPGNVMIELSLAALLLGVGAMLGALPPRA